MNLVHIIPLAYYILRIKVIACQLFYRIKWYIEKKLAEKSRIKNAARRLDGIFIFVYNERVVFEIMHIEGD